MQKMDDAIKKRIADIVGLILESGSQILTSFICVMSAITVSECREVSREKEERQMKNRHSLHIPGAMALQ